MPRKNHGLIIADCEDTMGRHGEIVAMQAKLRSAIFDSISEADVQVIIQKQVEKAKAGDEKALQFVMKYVLGFGQQVNLNVAAIVDVETGARLAKSATLEAKRA